MRFVLTAALAVALVWFLGGWGIVPALILAIAYDLRFDDPYIPRGDGQPSASTEARKEGKENDGEENDHIPFFHFPFYFLSLIFHPSF